MIERNSLFLGLSLILTFPSPCTSSYDGVTNYSSLLSPRSPTPLAHQCPGHVTSFDQLDAYTCHGHLGLKYVGALELALSWASVFAMRKANRGKWGPEHPDCIGKRSPGDLSQAGASDFPPDLHMHE